MDAFSVVDLNTPPIILTQPSSVSTIEGGTVAFVVGANGSLPLGYQWYHNDSPLAGKNGQLLTLAAVTTEQAGQYWVRVTNSFGAVTSMVAVLTVEAPTNATILVQPYGDVVPAGGYVNLSVVAAGTPPLSYQWFLNKQPLTDATNRNLTFTNVQPVDAGTYEVLVQDPNSGVWSLPSQLVVTTNTPGGAKINFRNFFGFQPNITNNAPVFDIDGVTPLGRNGFVAQLYAGHSLETLRPAGQPRPFAGMGYFMSQVITLPTVAPGAIAFAQVRAWESARGTSYEEARALGGRFGKSEILQVATAPDVVPPLTPFSLVGLKSFHLQAGLPGFNVGLIEFVEQSNGIIVWSVQGEVGFRYVVERSILPNDPIWRPFIGLTNETGRVTFTDSIAPAGAVFYRARILD
jgi:hypothetical protein